MINAKEVTIPMATNVKLKLQDGTRATNATVYRKISWFIAVSFYHKT